MGNLIIKQVQRAGLILLLVSGFHLVVWGVAKAQVPIRHVNLQQMMQYDLRALGMGGGFGPVARGEAALLYNPAGLAQQFRSIKLGFGLSVDIEEGDFYKDTTTISKGAPTQAKLTDYFTKYLNKSQNYRTEQYLNAVAMFGGPGFGVGAGKIKQDRYTFEFQDTVPNGALDVIPGSADSFFARQTRLSAMVYGLGFPAREGQILMGLTFKQMTYTEMSYSKPMDIMVTGGKISMPKDGWVYKAKGYDAGLLYRMESFSFMRPQWSMVFYNLGGVTLNTPSSVGSPDPATAETLESPMTYNLGLALHPQVGPAKLILTMEVEDMANNSKVYNSATQKNLPRSFKQRFNYGGEAGFWEVSGGGHVLNFRMGNHRGKFTKGMELNAWNSMRIVYTRYTDDFGSDGKQDRHPFKALTLVFGFAL